MSGLIYKRELCQQWEFIVFYISCLLESLVYDMLLWERAWAECKALSESGVTHLQPQALNILSCNTPVEIQGQAGWGCEQLGLVGDIPNHGRRVGTR